MYLKNKLLATILTVTSFTAQSQKTLLWEISGNGLTKPSYLYGTMHIVCAETTKLSEELKKVIKGVPRVTFEIDLNDASAFMEVLKYMKMKDGTKLQDLITPVEYQRVEEYFKSIHSPMPLSMMSTFKPYFMSSLITENILSCKEKSSLDMMIMEEAKKDEKEIQGLETLAFQASLFDSIPYQKQAEDLVTYVDSIENFKKITMEMNELYKQQDLHALDSLVLKSDPGMMAFMDLLLYNRNYRWADQITIEIYDTPVLYAVGAAHLGGEKGVIALLRKKGFTLKPLKN